MTIGIVIAVVQVVHAIDDATQIAGPVTVRIRERTHENMVECQRVGLIAALSSSHIVGPCFVSGRIQGIFTS